MQVEPQDAFQRHQQAMRSLQHLYGKEAIPDEVLNFFNVSLTAPTHAARDGSLHVGQTLRKLHRKSGPHQIPGPKALKLQCPKKKKKKKSYFTAMPIPPPDHLMQMSPSPSSCKCLPHPPHENVSLRTDPHASSSSLLQSPPTAPLAAIWRRIVNSENPRNIINRKKK